MKQKVFYLFALLLMAATSAWAQGSAVTLAGGTDDAANWTITPNADVAAGSQVAVSYGGSLKVSSLTAVDLYRQRAQQRLVRQRYGRLVWLGRRFAARLGRYRWHRWQRSPEDHHYDKQR